MTVDAWVYIVDAQGRLACDYTPIYALEICAPVLPLRVRSDGIDGLTTSGRGGAAASTADPADEKLAHFRCLRAGARAADESAGAGGRP